MRRFVCALLLTCATACTLALDLSDLAIGVEPSAEAGPDDEPIDATTPPRDVTTPKPDATPPGEGCTASGQRVRAIAAFDASPANGDGRACNVDAALVEDGVFGGIDRATGTVLEIDGLGVNGCIGVEMAAEVKLASIAIVARPAQNACGAFPCSGTACGSGHSLAVFGGPTRETLKRIFVLEATDTAKEYSAPAAGASVRFIAVCREKWGPERDDMEIDAVTGVCM